MTRSTFNSEVLLTNIRQLPDKLERAGRRVTSYHGTRGENAMRKNAPWTDRTTNARNGLHVEVSHTKNRHTLTFAHGVSYGIWLEVRWAGRYQIIMPTVISEGDDMMRSFRKLMGKI